MRGDSYTSKCAVSPVAIAGVYLQLHGITHIFRTLTLFFRRQCRAVDSEPVDAQRRVAVVLDSLYILSAGVRQRGRRQKRRVRYADVLPLQRVDQRQQRVLVLVR